MYFKVKGKDCYRWSAKDKYTKYRIYGCLTGKRDYATGAKPLFKHIKNLCFPQFIERKKSDKKIRFVIDKLPHYKKGFNKYFRRFALLTHGVPIKAKRNGLKYNNNCIERDHQYNKQRYKTMRGFATVTTADDVLNFFDVHYNFIDRQKINGELKTPAEATWIKIELGDTHHLLRLIEIAYDEK